MSYRGEKGVGKTIRSLLSKHLSKPLASPAATVDVAGLVRRFSQLDARELSALAAAVLKFPGMLLGGSFFLLRAFADNAFASQLVRIQSERGQHVVDTGVYGLVRHPMYLGGTLMFVGAPLLLGSLCGLLVALATIGFLVLRIFGEEKLLARDLEGYQEYLGKVRYRLLPHVW
jgi:protein-S-isoprenylcysteine O-methyltransferase Ste14